MFNRKSAFSLIELLIVIAIIGIVGAIILGVASSATNNARIQSTRGTIMSLSNACEQYRAIYYLYPNLLDHATGSDAWEAEDASNNATYTTAGAWDEDAFLTMNKRLRHMLETGYTVDEVQHEPPLRVSLASEGGQGVDKFFSDAWGNALRVCPSRDHSGDTPRGPTYDDQQGRFPPDIYSSGTNQIFCEDDPTNPPNPPIAVSKTATNIDWTNFSSYTIGSASSEIGDERDDDPDDIVSWRINLQNN